MNITMLKDRYITCEFDHDADKQEESQSEGGPKLCMPTLSTRTVRWQPLHREKLSVFAGPYHDLLYNMAFDPADNDSFYLFSPETIIKISQSNEVD